MYTYQESCLSVQYNALYIILHIKRTIPVTVYHLLLWLLERSMVESKVLAPGGNQDAVKMCSVKKCLAFA